MESLHTGERVEWLDTARGAGAVLVVIGHVERGIVGAGIAIGEAWQRMDMALYTFHMPLFFLLAGINGARSVGQSFPALLRRKLLTIAYPYLLWSLIQGAIVAIMAEATTGEHQWRDLLMIAWLPVGQFWFLYALFLYTIGAAALRYNGLAILTAGIAALVAADHVRPGTTLDLGLHHALFFAVGLIASTRIMAWRPASGAAWATAAAILYIIGWQIVPAHQRFGYLTMAAVPCAFAGSAFVMTFARTANGQFAAALAWLGRRAMAIFVLHILAASGVRILLVMADIPLPALAHLAIGTIAGIGLPCAAYAIARRMGALRILGLKP